MASKVIIIGGGMAGMSAGTYLQMNGYQTDIYELNMVPGGVCTSWKRGDYTIDFCIHWLVGSGPTDSFYERWSELVDMDEIQIVDHDEFFRIEDEGGKILRIFTNVDRLEQELMEKAPEDEEAIKDLAGAIRKLTQLNMPTDHSFNVSNLWFKMKWMWKMLPFLGVFGKYSRVSAADYAKKFSNLLLQKAINYLFEPETSMIFNLMTLAWMHNKAAGYPIGGSMNFAGKVAQQYRTQGGRFHFNRRVEKILVENDKAVGVELSDGHQVFADYVVSAADGYTTLYHMLGGKYVDYRFEKFYKEQKTFPSLVFAALGVNQTFEEAPHATIFPLSSPLILDPQTQVNEIGLRIHNFDPTLAPAGKTLITAMLETRNYQYWLDLMRKDPEQYEAQKQRLAEAFVDIVDQRLGGIRDKVEMVDVATPATIISFTNNWRGSFEGWLVTPETGFQQLPQTLSDLDNFYMCGHWVAVGGGLPPAMMSGRNVAEMICKKEGRAFEIKKVEREMANR
jgi:phytoene dehydrogenase-like protein